MVAGVEQFPALTVAEMVAGVEQFPALGRHVKRAEQLGRVADAFIDSDVGGGRRPIHLHFLTDVPGENGTHTHNCRFLGFPGGEG